MADIIACFGELLLRLTPTGGAALRDSEMFGIHVGGAEANVAVGLANLGFSTRMISTLPDNELGHLARKALAREEVCVDALVHGEGRMGLYFQTPAAGPKQGLVTYDRGNSAFALAHAYDHSAVLESARHLHVSGISLAVSEAASKATRSLVGKAKEQGLTVSVDGNYRPSLWALTSRDPRPEIAQLVSHADLFFGNHKDIALLLRKDFSADDGERRREAAVAALESFDNLGVIASTARHIDESGAHRLVGRIDTREHAVESAPRDLVNIVDRIGTGDAFAAGVLSGWLETPTDLNSAVERGVGLAILKHYAPGDFSRASTKELRAVMKGTADVAR